MGERLLKTAVLSATLGIALIAFSGMSLASDDFVTEGKGEKKIAKLQRKLGEAKEELAQAVAKRDALAQ